MHTDDDTAARQQQLDRHLDAEARYAERAYQIRQTAAVEAYCLLSAVAQHAEWLAVRISNDERVHATPEPHHRQHAKDAIETACCVDWFRDQLRGRLDELFSEDSDSPLIQDSLDEFEQSAISDEHEGTTKPAV